MKDTLREKFGLRRVPTFIYHAHTLSTLAKGLLKRHPLRSKTEPLSCTPFFVIGSGRSGNTLLRAILTSHPDLYIPPESYVLGRVIRTYRFFSFLPWPLLSRLVISEFESFRHFYTWEINLVDFYQEALSLPKNQRNLAHLLDKFYQYYGKQKFPAGKRWGDKTPLNTYHTHLIDPLFPQAQYIHIIRDGRDVVASYLKAGLYQNEQEACHRWLNSIKLAQDFGHKVGPARYLEIRYEDLVRQPEPTIQQICTFLTLPYQPHMLTFWQQAHTLGDTQLAHHHNIRNPINEKSIGKWQQTLSPTSQEYIKNQLHPLLIQLKYNH